MSESSLVAELSGCATAVEFAAAWWARHLSTPAPPEVRGGGAGGSVTGQGVLAGERVAVFAERVRVRTAAALRWDSSVRLIVQPGRAGLIGLALADTDPAAGDLGDRLLVEAAGEWDMRVTPTAVSLRTIHTLEPRIPLWPQAAPDLDARLAAMGVDVVPRTPFGRPARPKSSPSSLLRGERPFEEDLLIIAAIVPRRILRIDALARRIVLAYLDRDVPTLEAVIARIEDIATTGVDPDDDRPVLLPAWEVALYAVDDEYTALTDDPAPARLAPPTMETVEHAAILLAEITPAHVREEVLGVLCNLPTGVEVLDDPDAPTMSRRTAVLVNAVQLAAVSALTAPNPTDARLGLVASIAALEDTALSSTDHHLYDSAVSDTDACAVLHDLGGSAAALTASGTTSFLAAELITATQVHLHAHADRRDLQAAVEAILASHAGTTPTRPAPFPADPN